MFTVPNVFEELLFFQEKKYQLKTNDDGKTVLFDSAGKYSLSQNVIEILHTVNLFAILEIGRKNQNNFFE